MNESFPDDFHQYQIMHKIGQGETSSTYVALCITNNQHVCIKMIDLDLPSIKIDKLLKEISFLTTSSHKNMISYYTSFQVDTKIWLVTEFMDGGSCADILNYGFKNGIKDEKLIATILKNVLEFLIYFHAKSQIHRNIRANSIFLSNFGDVKVGNFGFAACLIQEGQMIEARHTKIQCSPFSAPELINGSIDGHTTSVDIWEVGITAIELATGKAPFCDLPPLKQVQMIIEGKILELVYESSLSFTLKDFIFSCLQFDPKKRLTAEELFQHKFMKKAQDRSYISNTLLSHLLPLDQRYQILHNEFSQDISTKSHLRNYSFDFPNETKETSNQQQLKARKRIKSTVQCGRFTVSTLLD